jgi:Spy/CpxP family protein refolding chaperone
LLQFRIVESYAGVAVMKSSSRINRALMLAAIWAVAGTAFAQGPGYWQGQGGGPGYGPGMGQGMMGGYGGPGTGQGMMGGYGGAPGYGPGYGGQGYRPGQGMMGQRMAPGMEGHHGSGRGAGMMQGIGQRLRALGLSEDQRTKVARIMEDTRRKNWDVLGQIQSERFKLREMVRGDKVDPNAAVEQKRKVDDLKRQVMRSRLEARNQVLALLTPEQREKARSFGPPRGSREGRG